MTVVYSQLKDLYINVQLKLQQRKIFLLMMISKGENKFDPGQNTFFFMRENGFKNVLQTKSKGTRLAYNAASTGLRWVNQIFGPL